MSKIRLIKKEGHVLLKITHEDKEIEVALGQGSWQSFKSVITNFESDTYISIVESIELDTFTGNTDYIPREKND